MILNRKVYNQSIFKLNFIIENLINKMREKKSIFGIITFNKTNLNVLKFFQF